jgi:hypothetical protein
MRRATALQARDQVQRFVELQVVLEGRRMELDLAVPSTSCSRCSTSLLPSSVGFSLMQTWQPISVSRK